MTEARPVYLHACGALGPGGSTAAPERRAIVDEHDTDLRPLTKALLGQSLRQASHYVELAVLGSRLCLNAQAQPLPAATSVYCATGLGDIRKTEALFDQVMPPRLGFAAPFDFINASPNIGAFYVARHAGVSARNLTVMQGVVSFEWALTLAQHELHDGRAAMALVGGVDENCFPRHEYLRRWPLRDAQRMGEGSAWWLLSDVAHGARAELLPVTRLATAGLGAAAWAEALRGSGMVDGTVIPSAQLTDEESAVLIRAYRTESFAAYTGAYPTASALALTLWLERAPARGAGVVHVSRAPDGDTMLTALRVC